VISSFGLLSVDLPSHETTGFFRIRIP